jgi:hypothetical protein
MESLLAPANSTNTEAHPSQVHLLSINTCTTPYNTRNLAGRTLLASQKRKLQQTGELSETRLPIKHQRASKEDNDAKFVQTTIAWLTAGLENYLSASQAFRACVTLRHLHRKMKGRLTQIT